MTIKEKLLNISAAFGFMIIWTMLITTFLSYAQSAQFGFNPPPTPLYLFVTACLIAPITEELVFRWSPLTVVKRYPVLTWPVIVISSWVFGWMHGGPTHVLIQGVFGVVFSVVYIRNGYCYWSSVFTHFLWNTTVIFFITFK